MVSIPLGKGIDRLRDDAHIVSLPDGAGLIRLPNGTDVVFLEHTAQVDPF